MPSLIRKRPGRANPLHGAGSFVRTIAASLIAGFCAIAVAVALSSVIRSRIESRVFEARRELSLARSIGERYAVYGDLNRDYRRLEPVLPALYSAVPSPEDILVFSNAVELLARETGNRITFQFSSQEPAQDVQFPDISLAMFDATLYGTKETFEKFIAGFDGLRPFGAIERLSMEGEQGIEGTAQMTLKGAAFIKRP